ncbi:unnamed protein product, partial [Porites evermanni]
LLAGFVDCLLYLLSFDFFAIGNYNWVREQLKQGVAISYTEPNRTFLFAFEFLMAGLHIDYISQQKLKQDTVKFRK